MQPRSSPNRSILIGGAGIIGVAVVVGAVVVGANLLRQDEPSAEEVLARPAAGEVRADHLADGTPVFVVGHGDGTVGVVSAFDTHIPYNLGKLNWWCPSAAAFDNPNHGSKWDAYGVKLGGPAPRGLPSWEVRPSGSTILVGDSRPGPPLETTPIGPNEVDRDWCMWPDDEVLYHQFDGWRVWSSPTEAIEEAADDWILLEGELVAVPMEHAVHLCALDGCADSARAANVEMPAGPEEFGPPGVGSYIAHVRDGVLVDVTRVVAPP